MNEIDEFLEHHGVKGQKWGVRRKRGADGKVSKSSSSDDHKTVSEIRKKPVHALSNKELKIANERLNLETNFKRLSPTKKEIGKQRTRAMLKSMGVTSAVGFANSPAGKKAIALGVAFVAGNSIKKGVGTIGQF